MFMVIGLQGRTTFGFVCGGTGALMTSAALFILFDRIAGGMRTITPRERRDQFLYWGAAIVIGVLIWLGTEWVAPLR
jgi:hypothetical protein